MAEVSPPARSCRIVTIVSGPRSFMFKVSAYSCSRGSPWGLQL